jgi:hypothetical protein
MAVAALDYVQWATLYPELSAVSHAQATAYFGLATVYLDNTDASPVRDVAKRTLILGMVTAHLAALAALAAGSDRQSPAPVGRMSSASEGSASASFDFRICDGGAWWAQTQYGIAAWQATAACRTARYVTGRQRR